jgi:hypothetical protein
MPIRTDVVYWPTFQPLADKAALRNQTEMRSVTPQLRRCAGFQIIGDELSAVSIDETGASAPERKSQTGTVRTSGTDTSQRIRRWRKCEVPRRLPRRPSQISPLAHEHDIPERTALSAREIHPVRGYGRDPKAPGLRGINPDLARAAKRHPIGGSLADGS